MDTVVITCAQDPLIERYCREAFGDRFQRKVDHNYPLSGAGTIHLLLSFRKALKEEAARQEWYDFAVDGDGKRCIIYEKGTHTPKLLVPEVRIVRT